MDDYPYCHFGQDGLLHTDGLHRLGLTTLLWDVLRRFGYDSPPTYRGRQFREFGLGRCEVHVDIPSNPAHPDWMAWSTCVRGRDMEDTLERAAQQALTEFCGRHLPDTARTPVALFPIQDQGNPRWQERIAAVCDTRQPGHQPRLALLAQYAQHTHRLQLETDQINSFQRLRLEEYDQMVDSRDSRITELERQLAERDRQVTELARDARILRQEVQSTERRVHDTERELLSVYRQMDQRDHQLSHTRHQLETM